MPLLHKAETHLDAIQSYLQNHQGDFYRLAYSYTKNRDDALDVVQEAIYKAIAKAHTLKDPRYLKTWFYRILVNESLTVIRKNKKYIYDETFLEHLSYEGDDIDQSICLYKAVQLLEPKLRTVIILRYFEDMKLDEIAAVTKRNLSTVKSQLYKSLDILKNLIGSDDFASV